MLQYPARTSVTVTLYIVMAVICTLLPSLGLLSLPIRILAGQVDRELLIETAAMIGILGYCFLIILPAINQYNLIELSSEGIRLRIFVFYFKWVDLDWGSLMAATRTNPAPFRPSGVWVVPVRELTFWHRCLGWRYRSKWEPVIVLMPELNGREKLIERINQEIDLIA